MAEPSTQITANPAAPLPLPWPSPLHDSIGVGKPGRVYKFFQALASLRLTVTLFAMSIVIVFCGTLRRWTPTSGPWSAPIFRSFFVWIPFQIFVPRTIAVGGGFPFPGGWLLGTLLLVNLLAAHALRFKLSAKRSGIILLHAGLIVLMVSELVTGLFAIEGSMIIYENGTSNYVLNLRETEVFAVIAAPGGDQERGGGADGNAPQTGATIQNDLLPFDIEVLQYMVNSEIYKLKQDEFIPYYWAGFPDPPAGGRISRLPDLAPPLFLLYPLEKAVALRRIRKTMPPPTSGSRTKRPARISEPIWFPPCFKTPYCIRRCRDLSLWTANSTIFVFD